MHTINLGDGIDAVVFSAVADNGTDTINGFKGGEGLTTDILVLKDVAELDGDGDLSGDGEDDTSGAFMYYADSDNKVDVDSLKVIIVKDTASSLDTAGVATTLNDVISNDADSDTIFIVDNGTDTGVYLYHDNGDTDGIKADELTEVATLTGVNTEDLYFDDILI